jgi:hypothetical protein
MYPAFLRLAAQLDLRFDAAMHGVWAIGEAADSSVHPKIRKIEVLADTRGAVHR